MSSGQLILLSNDGNVIYEPVNNILHVGSLESANVSLSGLKNLAFTINIDKCGRVSVIFYMKKVQINGKRVPKNFVRPLVNNSTIDILDYKFVWKYNPKHSRSYSLSPSRSATMNEIEIVFRNRKTIGSFAVNAANDENVSSSTTTKDDDTNIQMAEQTPAKNSVNGIVKDSAKKRSSFIPVKSNRTSELRRASIYRSKSVSDDLQPLQFITPKKPVPSTTMVKSVNAIIRSECRHNATSQKLANRRSLGAAASTNFPKMIDNLNLFNVVTNEMKMVGPSAYISNKFGQTNSPKRTPKKLLQKLKRLSLRSELREMGILKMNVNDTVTSSQDAENAMTLDSKESAVASEAENSMTSDGKESAPESEAENFMTPESEESAAASEAESATTPDHKESAPESEAENFMTPESKESAAALEVESATTPDHKESAPESETANAETPDTENKELSSTLTSSSSVELIGDSSECSLNYDENTDDDDESSDSSFSIISVDDDSDVDPPIESENAPEAIANGEGTGETGSIVDDKTIAMEQSDDIQKMEEPATESSANLLQVPESQSILTISTPIKRESAIRARRTSRLCSLDECCSPFSIATTPSKSKSTSNLVATPRSILKTPNASKTPRKTVRILETILHEDEDDVQSGETSISVAVPSDQQQRKDATVEQQSSNENRISEAQEPEYVTALISTVETTETPSLLDATLNVSGSVFAASSSELPTPIVSENVSNATEPADMLNATFDMNIESVVSSSIEQSNGFVTPKEDKLSDDDVIDQTTNTAVQNDDFVGEINVASKDEEATSTSAHEREETNIFDVKFDIEADDSEIHKQGDTSVPANSQVDGNNQQNGTDEVKKLLNTPKPLDKTNLVGMKELLDTPKALDKTNLVGMKELLDTPKPLDRTNLVGMKELLDTPKPLDRTNLVGMKELLQTPNDLDRTNLVGMKELLDTPKPLDRTNLVGMKELLDTPKPLDRTNLVGMKELLQTPNDLGRTNLVGMKELLDTPKPLDRTNLVGMKELLDTPKPLDRTNLVGMKELLNTPNDCDKTIDMRGVRDLLKTPELIDQIHLIGIAELVKTPSKQEEDNLEGTQDVVESPDSSTSTADDKKKFRVSFKFNSRDSLVHLLNSKMSGFGLAPLIPEVKLPEPVQPAGNGPMPNDVVSNDVSSDDFKLELGGGHSSNDEDVFASHSAESAAPTPIQKPQVTDEMKSETSSKVEAKLPKNRKLHASVAKTVVSHGVEVAEAVRSQPAKTSKRSTRKRKQASSDAEPVVSHDVSFSDDEATEALNSQQPTVASTLAKTPKRQGRKRQVSKAEPVVSLDVNVAENAEATEAMKSQSAKVALVPKTRKRLASAAKTVVSHDVEVAEAVRSQPAKTSKRSTRKHQASSDAEPVVSHDVAENAEATEPPTSQPAKGAKTPKKQTRKRQANKVESVVPQEAGVAENTEAIDAVKSQPLKIQRPTRNRQANVAKAKDSHDENVSESAEAIDAEPSKVASKAPRARKRLASAMEPSEGNALKRRAASKRRREVDESESEVDLVETAAEQLPEKRSRKPSEKPQSSKARVGTRNRKVEEIVQPADEPTPSTATRSSKRGKANAPTVSEIEKNPVTSKRPKRGVK